MDTVYQSQINYQTSKQEDLAEQFFLIEELGIPYLKVDEELHIQKWNHAFLEATKIQEADLTYTLDQLAEREPFFAFCLDLLEETIQTKKRQEDDYEDEEANYRIRVAPYVAEESLYIILEDRSLQKQFEHLLTFHHQMEAVSHIAAGVAHELRNPLSVIKGFLQLAKLTNEFEKYYDTILSELNRMNGIIEDFLSVSRKKIDRKRQSPVQIMESLIEIIKAECLLHDVELNIELTETTRLVHVNESMVKQVMLNLLRNSIEAYGEANKNRTLWIGTKMENDHYVVYVKDNGKGMPESVLKQIGKPFFTTKESGTGIGIPLCKKIIEDHGGSFKIESTYNVGTTVTVTLPLH
ncbi:HAMP domain-containing histidine kinase [Alkalihalobacillus oceani]|uniref:histidine kinase n=1 Tax=Halalkalibacter oceani TaxID=1653776 RepID=A0A9X2DLP1_9BACI|nr:HAMP domain-containing sensor histidine kinase [Halalkalibacter oceani]MCM3712859.1 HAMP domain-containing histidine kinase [Halalkalibacter oceani]